MLLKGNPPALSLASCKLKRCKAAQTRWHRTFPGSTFSRPSLVSISAEASLAKASRPVRCAATAAEEPSLQAELAALEAEQNEAVAKAELCAKTGQKLQSIIKLLDEMALQRMKSGNEEGARAVLVEKASVKEALASNAAKASANAMLAKKLAPLISSKRLQLPPSPAGSPKKPMPIWPPPPSFPSSSGLASSASSAQTSDPTFAAERAATAAEAASAVSSGAASPSAPSSPAVPSTPSAVVEDELSGAMWPQPKWQQSLAEARERIRAEEASARESGRAARLSAEESITSAKARLQRQAEDDLQAGLQRVRQAQLQSVNSIEEARLRIQEQDRQTLALVQQIMAKYRRGDYVTEDELEFAFQQLERRFSI